MSWSKLKHILGAWTAASSYGTLEFAEEAEDGVCSASPRDGIGGGHVDVHVARYAARRVLSGESMPRGGFGTLMCQLLSSVRCPVLDKSDCF
jgi:hypothetical protein